MTVIVRTALIPADLPDLQHLAARYFDWAHNQARTLLNLHEPPSRADDMAQDIDRYIRSPGAVFVAEIDGRLVGMLGLRTLSAGVAELKRMFVQPDQRNRGVGSALLDCALKAASELPGIERVCLDTASFMSDACALYVSRGFKERLPYRGSEIPKDLHSHWRFFERPI